MKGLGISVLVGVTVLAGLSLAASAQDGGAEESSGSAYEVAERDENGRVTKVTWNGQLYDICVEDGQDSCINPRDAGLDFGARELEYWPGKPASQIEEPLPYEQPPVAAEPEEPEEPDAFGEAFTDFNEPAAK